MNFEGNNLSTVLDMKIVIYKNKTILVKYDSSHAAKSNLKLKSL